ncbi:rab-GTPase-TBC domain-containing protein [Radiomyces spectabilis]|uniref:rab-GTPase-TBC domain-containing protein n=1 Tax=Radiomyces spectabilis TaxID=64574 RepID=UPI00221FC404|nr:rab-GTPase-TBC domain-containing protein [Radiomyces spectabilis]KAI8364701.1 rab-GTPase-TBC domain-containing protein [Radiomyces spectabilis]
MHSLKHNFIMGSNFSVARSLHRAQQTEKILAAMASRNLGALRQIAREPEGYVHDTLRRFVWPILLHTHQGCYIDEKGSDKDLPDPSQISKDVERSLYYYPQDISPMLKAHKQQELHQMIVEILWRNPRLKYYQGFHDICTCFLLVLGKKAGIPAAENVALFFLRDAMLDSFDPISKQLRLMSSIIEYEDPKLTSHLEHCNIMPYYALSWILTWFSHDFEDLDKVVRLFDVFIASSAMMPIYVASAITLLRRTELLQANAEILHSLITHVPQDIDLEMVIQTATLLETKYPLVQLQKQSGIWLHDESALNTWDKDYSFLGWDDVPNRLQADKYLSHSIPKEEWEDEMLTEWMERRRRHFTHDGGGPAINF